LVTENTERLGLQACVGRAAREARREAGVRLVRVAAAAELSEAALARFERGETWPKKIDQVLAAYASELRVERAVLLEAALRLYAA
jgi:transcriptional regulator with XRE-family HTH domain